jgi:hypothetical protein
MALSSEPEVGAILASDIQATQARYEGVMEKLTQRLDGAAELALRSRVARRARISAAPSRSWWRLATRA